MQSFEGETTERMKTKEKSEKKGRFGKQSVLNKITTQKIAGTARTAAAVCCGWIPYSSTTGILAKTLSTGDTFGVGRVSRTPRSE